MPILDAFFTVAPPFLLFCLLFASIALSYNKRRGIYEGAEGAKRRDAVNKKYRTTAGAVVIAGVFTMFWGVTVAALLEQWGPRAFTFVVSAILVVPFLTVCAAVIMLYMFAVHGFAKARSR